MRGYLDNRPNEVSTIYTKTATYSGKVIMSGERGLLFSDQIRMISFFNDKMKFKELSGRDSN
jgi:hypothetical protein